MGDKVLYVSKEGNNNWSGTLEKPTTGKTDGPLATLKKARDRIRELKSVEKNKKISYSVLVRAGKYYLDETFNLMERDSGTKENPVTYKSFPGEEVILSGGKVISDWVKHDEKIYKVQIPEFRGGKWKSRKFFYDGKSQNRSRWPKNDLNNPFYTGWAFVKDKNGEDSRSSFIYNDNDFIKNISKPSEGEVNIFLGSGWWNSIFPIESINREDKVINISREVMQTDGGPIYMDTIINGGERFYIENLLEGLTRPGEWCFDSEEGIIYFRPPGDDAIEVETVAPVLKCLINMVRTSYINISGFTFTETVGKGDNHHRFDVEGIGVFSLFGDLEYCGEALHLKSTKHCLIEKNYFDSVGGNGIYLEKECFRNIISSNEISYAGANGIAVAGNRERHPRFDLIENNHIHNTGSILKFTGGISLGMSDGIMIKNNYIHHSPHHAINLGSNGLGRNIVEYNRICFSAMECHDTAAINSWGDVPFPNIEGHTIERSGHIIRFNHIADTLGCKIDIEGNHTKYIDFAFGIYLDDFTSNCYVYGNNIIRAGKGVVVHNGKHNIIENNILIDCPDNIWLQNPASQRLGNQPLAHFMVNNIIRNNIISFSDPETVLLYFVFWSKKYKDEMYSAVGHMDNNIFYNSGNGEYNIKLHFRNDFAVDENTDITIIPFEKWMKDSSFDANSIFTDPMFVSVEDDNYQLKPESPAFRLGFQRIDMDRIGLLK